MKIFLLIFLVTVSSISHSAQWVIDENPADVIEMGGELMSYPKGLYIQKSSGFSNPDGCSNNQYVHFDEEFLIDRVISAALYAQSMGKRMKFYTNGCKSIYIHGHAFQLID